MCLLCLVLFAAIRLSHAPSMDEQTVEVAYAGMRARIRVCLSCMYLDFPSIKAE